MGIDTGEVPNFNMALMFLIQIDKARASISQAITTQDYITWIRKMEEIYISIKPKIEMEIDKAAQKTEVKTNERENIKLMQTYLDEANKCLGTTEQISLQSINDRVKKQAVSIQSAKIYNALMKAYSHLMVLLWKYDFVFPKRESMDWGQEIDRDFSGF